MVNISTAATNSRHDCATVSNATDARRSTIAMLNRLSRKAVPPAANSATKTTAANIPGWRVQNADASAAVRPHQSRIYQITDATRP